MQPACKNIPQNVKCTKSTIRFSATLPVKHFRTRKIQFIHKSESFCTIVFNQISLCGITDF